MRIALASDHAGYTLKTEIADLLTSMGHQVSDFGAPGTDPADLPDHVYPAALAVGRGEAADLFELVLADLNTRIQPLNHVAR